MLLKNKIIPIALVAALLGGSVGAIVSRKNTDTAATTSYSTTPSANLLDEQSTRTVSDDSRAADDVLTTKAEDIDDPASYRAGFLDGFQAARERTSDLVVQNTAAPARVVYRNAPARRSYGRSNYSGSRQVYYDYNNQPRKRSFWQKHRDKLTVAMGAGGGALLGGLIGGKKGAVIGALAGGGGSALWTYKLRKRNRNY
ncbi:MAG TPA: hypothetical protein VJ715_20970 [Pyrinomonadaceae bacterium]|nr:hypothetical protein [Pyrinomonadaceae bacterium]